MNSHRNALLALSGIASLALSIGLGFVPSAEAKNHANKTCSKHHVEAMLEVADHYVEVLNTRDTSQFDQIFTDDYVDHTGLGDFVGVAGIAGIMDAVYTAFPDIEYQLDEVLVEGDRISVRYSWVGTHSADFFGHPATGNVVHGRGMEVSVIESGKLLETWNYADLYVLFAQIESP